LRLINGAAGTNPNTGRVVIKFDDIWGSLCDWGWNNANARVVCKEKLFVDGLAKIDSSDFGLGYGRVWFERIYCHGTEKSLMGCLSDGFNSSSLYSYCRNHKRVASVACYNEVVGKIEYFTVRMFEQHNILSNGIRWMQQRKCVASLCIFCLWLKPLHLIQ
jgi:hypothetical protein